jgi:hypothetical protein
MEKKVEKRFPFDLIASENKIKINGNICSWRSFNVFWIRLIRMAPETGRVSISLRNTTTVSLTDPISESLDDLILSNARHNYFISFKLDISFFFWKRTTLTMRRILFMISYCWRLYIFVIEWNIVSWVGVQI